MNRDRSIETMRRADEPFDVLIIGGGSTGLGAALDAALRGFRVALVERGDFASGTSSKSTKLIHGGLRYLKQGNIPLVRESLRERERLLRNAPSLVTPLGFVIPCYSRFTKAYYRLGVKAYDLLSGSKSLANSGGLSASETLKLLPSVHADGLVGGTLYFDAQFDDARLCITLAIAATAEGATLANYTSAAGFLKDADGRVIGVDARDEETGETFEVHARVVLNACGPWCDEIRQLDDANAQPMIAPSQGTHIVLDRRTLGGEHAMMIPKTDDGRILFAIPFGESIVVGTTDTALDRVPREPGAMPDEIEFILRTLNRYVQNPIERSDIRSVFAGVRPLVRSGSASNTSKIARNHVVRVAKRSGLLTVAGGKWTTFRQIAQDAIDACADSGQLERTPCATHDYSLEPHIRPQADRDARERVHPNIGLSEADIERMVTSEMAMRIEDVLARRNRALIHDARHCIEAAPAVGRAIANVRGEDKAWLDAECGAFVASASRALLGAG